MAPPLPPEQIGLFGWRNHRSALWWLGILYRRPKVLDAALARLTRSGAVQAAVMLYLHGLPWLLLCSFAGRLAMHTVGGISWDWSREAVRIASGLGLSIAGGLAFWLAGRIMSITFGIAVGLAFGLAFGIAGGTAFGSDFEIVVGLASGLVLGIVLGMGDGLVLGMMGDGIGVGFAFGGGLGITGWIAGWVGGRITGVMTGGIAGWIALGIAGGIAFTRAFYLVPHFAFTWPNPRGRLYPYHPVAWDDLCGVPFPRLGRLLVAFAELQPERGEAEVDRLISTYPGQRKEALRARMTLLARAAGRSSDLWELDRFASQMPRGDEAMLQQSIEVAVGMREIALLQARLRSANRAVLREPLAEILVKEIENFRHRIGGFEEPLQTEFRAAALEWQKLAKQQLDEARIILKRKPVGQVYRAGDPVNREGEAFVFRDSVIGKLDQQVSLGSGCPGIVLYARRRMGKSTLLANLDGFLPDTIVTRVISMQDAEAFSSLESLAAKISEGEATDLPGLSQYLTRRNEQLQSAGKRLLLAFDEYENIDVKIGEGVFSKDLLATVRESIQRHRHIIWLFAGSTEIERLRHAEWPSYLVSARTIEIPLFSMDETRLLLTDPLKHSPVFRSAGNRPRFAPEMWGEGGMERIHREAGGWPHLLQLIAETLVELLNSQVGDSATPHVSAALMEQALDEATVSGQNVLYQLLRGESELPGEWEYLSGFRSSDEQAAPQEESIRRSLLRRQLIERDGERWRLRVPLMGRWLRLRG